MASPAASSSPPPANEEAPPQNQENDNNQQPPQVKKQCTHKTKTIQFFDRTTPIVLQNENGPCPLLAICNVLLLRNILFLNPDDPEVSQAKLVELVADHLFESNSNVNCPTELFPKLTTGIDVNVKFSRIDDFDFESTPECSIFNLLDIPLYHGWIVDPQDKETASAIGSNSYNAIMEQLVELETQNLERIDKNNPEDCVDFAAATTATLGVPCPSLSTTRSFENSPSSVSDPPKRGKGDLQEEAALLAALKLSKTELPSSSHVSVGSVDTIEGQNGAGNHNLLCPELSLLDNCNDIVQSTSLNSEDFLIVNDAAEKSSPTTAVLQTEDIVSKSPVKDVIVSGDGHTSGPHTVENVELQSTSTSSAPELSDNVNGYGTAELPSLSLPNADSVSSSGRIHPGDVTSSLGSSEPMYEGEECISDSVTKVQEKGEPEYEGEAILAEQADKTSPHTCNGRSKVGITQEEGDLIRNFLKNNASQLTVYGLFSLQEGLKEGELCVFFRNNHFSTMYKYKGDLYLLVTDQGYLNQPDLVWEKLDEVNGNTLFVNSNFNKFKADSPSSATWDERNAMTSTADFISSIDNAGQSGSDSEINSDFQLAMALQQQEFDERPQRQNPQQQQEFDEQPQRPNPQQPSASGGSRLVTGSQVRACRGRYPVPQKPESKSKSKDKCMVILGAYKHLPSIQCHLVAEYIPEALLLVLAAVNPCTKEKNVYRIQ